ncbi:MAG: hypothetical protein A3F83_05265 [Candidatus Glassbacteria bacterium RIFCSPLOWO2_12_FULL_58_11]|uniref:Uncharacterized protein n=2 Tax=Candidatus Glassiibacteriota TaxID=1817805 RepID=A0A1F5Z0Q2_9BACT|nr:MAG: hypothetical protein A2Z86_05455 [Candidatus Glassbacteria bacterium GWA2_58_10]OGG05976.1 MAG: hypothetical protein A3F83_05265 [Candidatus Glassbacteria bacterium RIFCSPLOWO2_12_FULL_58_11]
MSELNNGGYSVVLTTGLILVGIVAAKNPGSKSGRQIWIIVVTGCIDGYALKPELFSNRWTAVDSAGKVLTSPERTFQSLWFSLGS